MFTIKFYRSFDRMVIKEADSFTVLRSADGSGEAEITLHYKDVGLDHRVDIRHNDHPRSDAADAVDWPPVYDKAIIENQNGRTTEIIGLSVRPIGWHGQQASL